VSTAEAPRQLQFLLAEAERRTLRWIAARLPRRVLPDHLTILGMLAAVGIAVAYAASAENSAWLWAASGLLVVHWLGDSLDGTLARVRGIERPRYGYYLDHLVDAVATACIGIGLGLSAHMLLTSGAIVVVAYLMLSINTYLETQALGSFNLGYGLIGPTEIRLLLVALNTALALGVTPHLQVAGATLGLLDFAGAGLVLAMLLALGVRAAGNLRRLAALEPQSAAP
jgi:phosphatidylglycerophosphate synthase